MHLVNLEKRENPAQEVCLENQDLRVQKDLKAHVERLGLQDHLVKKEKWASQDSLDILAEEELKVTEVWLAKEEETVQRVQQVHQEQMVTEVNLATEDPEVSVVSEVFLDQWVQKVKLAHLVHLELLVLLDLREIVVLVAILVLLDHLVFQEKMVW